MFNKTPRYGIIEGRAFIKFARLRLEAPPGIFLVAKGGVSCAKL
jgi:hypothetical protein